jgi:hypothetical protein
MASRKRFRLPPRPVYDIRALFLDEALKIARGAGILDAYRKASGMVVVVNKSTAAIENLRAAAEQARQVCPTEYRYDWARAMEHAAKMARCTYVGQWWTVSRCSFEPETLMSGDEYFSRETIRLIVERSAPVIPDASGETLSLLQPAAQRRRAKA